MKKLTPAQYQDYVELQQINLEIRQLQADARKVKERVFSNFGRAKTVRTPAGTEVKIVKVEVIPTEVPAPYSYDKLVEREI